jgi:GMP synthase-like glutamine amidotransferase
MNILVVDHGTHYKKRLNDLLDGHRIAMIDHSELNENLDTGRYDFIVMSGAYGVKSVKESDRQRLESTRKFLNSVKIPVIGLCYSAQLIAYAYGARLSNVPGGERLKGIKLVWNVKKTPFDFFRYNGARVWASQRWRITELPDELECWCASAEGVEVFKHKKKPIYGLQFHPEHHTLEDDGRKIFERIIDLEFPKQKQPAVKPKKTLAKV